MVNDDRLRASNSTLTASSCAGSYVKAAAAAAGEPAKNGSEKSTIIKSGKDC